MLVRALGVVSVLLSISACRAGAVDPVPSPSPEPSTSPDADTEASTAPPPAKDATVDAPVVPSVCPAPAIASSALAASTPASASGTVKSERKGAIFSPASGFDAAISSLGTTTRRIG